MKKTNKNALQFNTVKETAKTLEQNKTAKIDLNAGIAKTSTTKAKATSKKPVSVEIKERDLKNRPILFKTTNDFKNAIVVVAGMKGYKSFQSYMESIILDDVNKSLKSGNVNQAMFDEMLDKYFPKERGFKSKF